MITNRRYDLILDYLNRHGTGAVTDFVNLTSTSTATIRRDLTHLEEEGLLKRIHGGATLERIEKEATYTDKAVRNLKEKIHIARLAAATIEDEEIIFIDAGTSTYEMLPFIKAEYLTVVTNSIPLIEPLLKDGHNVHLAGGKVKSATRAIVGDDVISKLRTLYFDKCFIGTNGVDMSHGYSTPDGEEAVIKRSALEQSKEKYILADSSKFHKTAFVKFADIREAALITDDPTAGFTGDIKDQTTVIGGD